MHEAWEGAKADRAEVQAKTVKVEIMNGSDAKSLPRAGTLHAKSASADSLADMILLDSGASHVVRRRRKGEMLDPDGKTVRLKLAVGTVKAWMQGGEVIVEKHMPISRLYPLGVLMRDHGLEIRWSSHGATLLSKDGVKYPLTMCSGSPYIHKDLLEKLLEHRACAVKATLDDQDASEEEDAQDDARAVAKNEDEVAKMDLHRARCHFPKDPNCPVCTLASMRRRPHTRLNQRTQCGG